MYICLFPDVSSMASDSQFWPAPGFCFLLYIKEEKNFFEIFSGGKDFWHVFCLLKEYPQNKLAGSYVC